MRSNVLVSFSLMGILDLEKKSYISYSVFVMLYGFNLVSNVNLGRVTVLI